MHTVDTTENIQSHPSPWVPLQLAVTGKLPYQTINQKHSCENIGWFRKKAVIVFIKIKCCAYTNEALILSVLNQLISFNKYLVTKPLEILTSKTNHIIYGSKCYGSYVKSILEIKVKLPDFYSYNGNMLHKTGQPRRKHHCVIHWCKCVLLEFYICVNLALHRLFGT